MGGLSLSETPMTTTALNLDTLVLTDDQENALDAFVNFLMDPFEPVFVLKGYAGCGKSTLVRVLLNRLPKYIKTARLINPRFPDYTVQLTATTNKAAEALAQITNEHVLTIHSFLGLRVRTNLQTNVTTLVATQQDKKINYILVVDEASYVDANLLSLISQSIEDCKIVFIGDPAQLTPVKSSSTPVFEANFTGAELTKVVRQAAGNPIIDLSTKFRETVTTGEFFSFKPDGQHVVYLDRNAFNQQIVAEFTRPDWRFQDSKILAWTNSCVIDYNRYVRGFVKGQPQLEVGDYAVNNSYVTTGRGIGIKTDQMVQITGFDSPELIHDVHGCMVELDGRFKMFFPSDLTNWKEGVKKARASGNWTAVDEMENQWVDLRAAYACTINKAQGSTFDRVYVDLDDVRRCNSGDQIARMLYVGVSRARHQVILTGDLI